MYDGHILTNQAAGTSSVFHPGTPLLHWVAAYRITPTLLERQINYWPLIGIHNVHCYCPLIGCDFSPRCRYAMQACLDNPPMFSLSADHQARCWLNHPNAPSASREVLKVGVMP